MYETWEGGAGRKYAGERYGPSKRSSQLYSEEGVAETRVGHTVLKDTESNKYIKSEGLWYAICILYANITRQDSKPNSI